MCKNSPSFVQCSANKFFQVIFILLWGGALYGCAGGGGQNSSSPISAVDPVNGTSTNSSPVGGTPDIEGIYYIHPDGSDAANDGTAARPWRTIQYGIDQLSAGETLSVGAGIYKERVRLEGADDSGQSGLPITLRAEPGAIIDGSEMTPNGEDALLILNGVSYVVIDGFEIRNLKTPVGFRYSSTPIGILVTGTSDQIEVRNNIVKYIENNSTCTQEDNCGVGANGIAVYGREREGITNISFLNNEVAFNKTMSSEAFVLNGNVSGFLIVDNYVHDNNNIGLDFIGLEGQCANCSNTQDRARNGLVSRNRVVYNSTTNLGGNPWYQGTASAGGIYVDGGINIIIDGNFVTENDIGIEIASEAAGEVTSDIVVRNNVVFKNREAGLALGGYNANAHESGGGGVNRIGVFNNSFYKNDGWGTDITVQYRVTNSQFYNNAVYTSGDASEGAQSAISGDLSRADLEFSHNLWWGDGGIDGPPVSDVSAQLANPVFTDPENGNLMPTAQSPLIDFGKNSNAFLNWDDLFWRSSDQVEGVLLAYGEADFNGNSRRLGDIDIGAYERQ